MDLSTPDDIQSLLSPTPYACTSLVPLKGGYANTTLRGTLTNPLQDGSKTVVVKHTKDIQLTEDFKLEAVRLDFENEMLHTARQAIRIEVANSVIIGIPEVYYYDRRNKILVMQDAGVGVKDLKNSLLAGEISAKQADIIGEALARFSSRLHSWGKTESHLYEDIQKHRQATNVYTWATYGRLAETIGMVSDGSLEAYREIFHQAHQVMSSEIRDSANSVIIHGDYWTGNILVSLDQDDMPIGVKSLYVIDWEISRVGPALFDIGQMSAEIFLVNHFRQKTEATRLLDAFLGNYEGLTSLNARCKMAVHFGTHLVVWPIRVPGWGTTKEVEECAKLGAQFIEKGLQGDVEWLKESVLGEMFRRPIV